MRIAINEYFRLYGGDYAIEIYWFVEVGFDGVFVGKHPTLF